MARFDLTDFEWSVIEPLLPNKPRGVAAGGRPAGAERHLLAAADRGALGGHSGALRAAHDLLQPLHPLAQGGRLGPAF